jgi:hypothetical protein
MQNFSFSATILYFKIHSGGNFLFGSEICALRDEHTVNVVFPLILSLIEIKQ